MRIDLQRPARKGRSGEACLGLRRSLRRRGSGRAAPQAEEARRKTAANERRARRGGIIGFLKGGGDWGRKMAASLQLDLDLTVVVCR